MIASKTRFEYWKENNFTIDKIFRLAVSENPNKIALVDGSVMLTYKELDELTDGLAGYLQENGLEHNKIVAVYLEECYQYIVACLAILKAGGAYLHLDLDYDQKIIYKILAENSLIAIISKSKHLSKFNDLNIKKILLDRKIDWTLYSNKFRRIFSMLSSNIAFIGYSSGTTGIPKGVAVSHKAAIYAISKFWKEVWHLSGIDRFAYSTYLPWDAMGPIMFSVTGYIVPNKINNNPVLLAKYIKNNKINHIFFTPSFIRNILEVLPSDFLREHLSSLKVIWLGGEVLTSDLLAMIYNVLPDTHLFNNYGSSECFVVAQGALNKKDVNSNFFSCPVGRFLPEMKALVLNDKMKKVDTGDIGELYVSGPCLAGGYIKNHNLTRKKFIKIKNRFYFKTGDFARFLPDGRLVIEGRKNFFINKNQRDISLIYIQQKIKNILSVNDCLIIYKESDKKNSDLICFLVKDRKKDQSLELSDMKEILSSYLPDYLIPKYYIYIDKIPVNKISKKINYRELRNLIENSV